MRKQGKIIFDHDRSIFCWISRKVAFFWVNILGRFFSIVMMKCSLFSPLSALCGCVRIFSFLFSPRALWLCPNIPFSLWLCSDIPPACGTAPGSNARKKMGDRGACWFVRFLLLRRQKRACAFAVATIKGVSLSGAQATGSLTGRGPETYCVLLESQQATGFLTLNGPEPYCVLLSGAQATGF